MKKLQRHISLIFTVLLLQSCDTGPVEPPIPEPRKIVWEDLNRSASSIIISNQQNIFISTSQTLERSSNGGDTWQVVRAGHYRVYKSWGHHLYAVGGLGLMSVLHWRAGMLFSTDEGTTWFDITPNAWEKRNPNKPTTFIAGRGEEVYFMQPYDVYRSFNGGLDWDRVTANIYAHGPGFATDTGILIVIGWDAGRVVHRSTDRGLTWVEMPIKMRGGYAYQNGMICIGGDNQQLWISEDDGITWYPQLLPEKSDHGLVLTMTPQNEIIIGGSYAEVIKFYRSVDGGATWTEENTGLNLLASKYSRITTLVAAKDGTLYAALRGGTNTLTLIRSR